VACLTVLELPVRNPPQARADAALCLSDRSQRYSCRFSCLKCHVHFFAAVRSSAYSVSCVQGTSSPGQNASIIRAMPRVLEALDLQTRSLISCHCIHSVGATLFGFDHASRECTE
jgi:hypothetical protein